ncbi:TonB-dependent receptor [Chlorobium phaeovibrioides]|nr:TonB-dependent receptor [Chlorobium phaeovibrioides]
MIESMNKKHSILFLAVALLASNSAKAEDAVNSYTMPEVVVTANRTETEVEKIPAYVQVVTAEDIRDSGAQSVPEALTSLSGVHVTNNNKDIVDIGGFGETANRNVAVLVDGRKFNSIDMAGPNWSSIPIENIERIEVVYGGASVLYGDNATGGVINIITKKSADKPSFSADISGGTNGKVRQDAALTIGNRKMSLLFGATHYATDGYRDHSEAKQSGVYSRFKAQATDDLLIKADFSNTNSQNNLPGSLTATQIIADRTQVGSSNSADWSDSRLTILGGGFEYDAHGWGTIYADASYTLEKRHAEMPSYVLNTDIATKLFAPKYVLKTSIGGMGDRFIFGADYQVSDYETFEYSNGTFQNHDRKSIAAYAQNELSITQKIMLSTGYRFEDAAWDFGSSKGYVQTSAKKWAGDIGLVYNIQPHSKVYGKVYRAYRYPVSDEFYNMRTNTLSVLKPASSVGYEVGSQYAVNDALVLSVRGYVMGVDDEILYYDSDNRNYPETRHMGGNLDASYNVIPNMTLIGGIGYTQAEFTAGIYDGKEIPLVPKWQGNLGVKYNWTSKLHSRLMYNYVGEQYAGGDVTNSSSKLSEYQTVDMAFDYETKHVDLYLNATNIFNEKYVSYVYYSGLYPMPEAEYTVGMRVKF